MEQEVRARELKEFLTQAAKLTSTQREQVLAHLGAGVALDRATAIVEGRLAQNPGCPKCQAQHVVRNGQADGLQRYKCRGCGATFNALTGTPLARLRHRNKWVEQAQAMNDGLSVPSAGPERTIRRQARVAAGFGCRLLRTSSANANRALNFLSSKERVCLFILILKSLKIEGLRMEPRRARPNYPGNRSWTCPSGLSWGGLASLS